MGNSIAGESGLGEHTRGGETDRGIDVEEAQSHRGLVGEGELVNVKPSKDGENVREDISDLLLPEDSVFHRQGESVNIGPHYLSQHGALGRYEELSGENTSVGPENGLWAVDDSHGVRGSQDAREHRPQLRREHGAVETRVGVVGDNAVHGVHEEEDGGLVVESVHVSDGLVGDAHGPTERDEVGVKGWLDEPKPMEHRSRLHRGDGSQAVEPCDSFVWNSH